MRKVSYKEKGITLVALVITIILLLILTGVTLSTALGNNGLFQKAKLAGEKYKEAEKEEAQALEDISKEIDNITINYNDYIGAFVTNYEPIYGSITISKEQSGVEAVENTEKQIDKDGNQTFETENLGWRIWDYDENNKKIRIISNRPTSKSLTLTNVNGYNNGVYILNEICRKCYGQYDATGNKNRGITVSNLKRSDIQKVITYDYTKYGRNNDSNEDLGENGKFKYGGTKSFDLYYKYPIMWKTYDSEWSYEKDDAGNVLNNKDKEGLIWEKENTETGNIVNKGEGDSNTKFKASFWYRSYNLDKVNPDEWINPKYYDLIFKDGNTKEFLNKIYWLSTRCTIINEDRCYFALQRVDALSYRIEINATQITNSVRHKLGLCIQS